MIETLATLVAMPPQVTGCVAVRYELGESLSGLEIVTVMS